MPTKPRVLFVWSDQDSEYNCSWHRCHVPLRALRQAGHPVTETRMDQWMTREPASALLSEQADLIFIQRNLFGNALSEALYWRARGKTLVLDVDDDYRHMGGETGSFSTEFWKFGTTEREGKTVTLEPPPFECLEIGSKICGAVSAPSRVLCEDWSPYANTYYIPNYLETRLYRRYDVYKEPGKVYIGWVGSMGHHEGWKYSGVALALKHIMATHKEVILAIGGDTQILSLLDCPTSRVLTEGWKPLALYSQFLSRYDIGLVPLEGEYDRRRSGLKSLEYTIMGIPWVGSDLEPNREVNSGVLVKNTVEAWQAALENTLAHLKEEKDRAREYIEEAMGWSVENNVDKLLATYRKIIRENR
jgi:Glycosyl transferases group 1